MDYTVEQVERIHTGPIFGVTRDRIRMPDGKVLTFDVVRHGESAAVVPLADDETVILIKQFRYIVDQVLWEIPAGRCEPGETPLSCAKREMEEEVGYRAQKMEEMLSVYTAPGFSDERIHIYLGTGLHKVRARPEPDEILEVHRVPLREAMEMIDDGLIRDAKSVVGILYAARLRSKG